MFLPAILQFGKSKKWPVLTSKKHFTGEVEKQMCIELENSTYQSITNVILFI